MSKKPKTVSLFGTAVDETGEACMLAKEITVRLTENGFRIATGGQKAGTMEVATLTAYELAQKQKRKNLEPIGYAMHMWGPMEIGNIQIVSTLSKKIQKLIDGSFAYICLPGRMGTFLEAITALHNINIYKNKKLFLPPLILLDPSEELAKKILVVCEMFHLFKDNGRLGNQVFFTKEPDVAYQIVLFFSKIHDGHSTTPKERQFLDSHSLTRFSPTPS